MLCLKMRREKKGVNRGDRMAQALKPQQQSVKKYADVGSAESL